MAQQHMRKRHQGRMARVASIPTRYEELLDGTISMDDLDDEEILRGRLRNSQGDFRGRPPMFIPAQFATELMRRQQAMIREQLGPLSDQALKKLTRLLERDTTVHDGPQIQAIKLALEYGLGKPTEKIEINAQVRVSKYDDVIESSTLAITEGIEEDEL